MQHAGQHHYHVRQRIYKKLEPVPHPKKLGRILDRVMPGIALIGPIALIPQVLQLYTLRDASDLSPITWILWEILSGVWLLYGIVHKEVPIIVGNLAFLVLQAIVIIAIFIY